MAKHRLASALSTGLFVMFLIGAPGAPASAADSSELVAAVKTVGAQTDKLRAMMADLSQNQFQVVSVQSVLSPADEPAFRAAVQKNAADIADMRETLTHTTLTGNDGVVMPLSKLLQAQDVKINQVVGVYVGGGRITLFYQ